jgi:hypothetical protein
VGLRGSPEHRIYKLIRLPGLSGSGIRGETRDLNKYEVAKDVKRLLRSYGVESRYLSERPDLFAVEGKAPETLKDYFKELPVKSILEWTGFEYIYKFNNENKDKYGYGILKYPPYKCHRKNLLVKLLYETDQFLEKFIEIINHVHISEDIQFVPQKLSENLSELFTSEYDLKLALISHITTDQYKKVETLARAKLRSYREGISRVQIIDGDKMLKIDKTNYTYYLANLLSALYFKSGCVPFYIQTPQIYDILHSAFYIGVALKKTSKGYVKGVATIMTGLGEIIAQVDTDKHHILRGDAMEFGDIEMKKFIKIIKEHMESYKHKLGIKPPLVVVIRTRRFKDDEWKALKGSFYPFWRRLIGDDAILLVMSLYKTKWNIGEGMATFDGDARSGVWLLQPQKVSYAVQLVYRSTGYSPRLPAAAYLYLRALDFVSRTRGRISIPPVKYAYNYLKWRAIAEQW